MAFNSLGITDWEKRLKELISDEKIYKELEKKLDMITPISEQKYLELNKK